MTSNESESARVAVIGGGPAGLMAAEALTEAGCQVDLYDAMPSVGRKFLLAGKGGLNLTHGEAFEPFVGRYAERRAAIQPWIESFDAQAVRDWAAELGVETFVGSSGRVFPADMKAAPLLRAWLHRLRGQGVRFHMRQRWLGWTPGDAASPGSLRLAGEAGEIQIRPAALVLALGGGSWARLGSDGVWVPWLAERGVDIAPLQPSNCGFEVAWSAHLRERHAGAPLKGVAIEFSDAAGLPVRQAGEFVVTGYGVEGSLIYAASGALRSALQGTGRASFKLDLLPQRSLEWVASELAHPRGPRSLATHLKTRLGLHGVKAALLYERVPKADLADPQRLAAYIKGLDIEVAAARPIDEAISSAGGVRFEALDDALMLRALPGVFCAGEMLDWEAPTGGYLITACLATGRAAGQGAARWLAAQAPV